MKQLRIAITGPESSGKTSFAQQLALLINGTFIPEYAREYLLNLNRVYNQTDLDNIAKGQLKLWEENRHEPIVICDTEMLVMHIWSEVSYKNTSSTILQLLDNQQFDHYFLCSPDIPWEEDPLREHPEMRDELFEYYLQKLIERNVPFTILQGSMENRTVAALKAISHLIPE